MRLFITMLIYCCFLSCSSQRNQPDSNKQLPAWLQQRIEGHLSEPTSTPPIRIDACLWQGDTVYHESAPCCDQFTTLYNKAGAILCYPTGGITGQGDGKCPSFRSTHQALFTVWEDDRNSEK